jgi:predicted nucleic acid-binding protein
MILDTNAISDLPTQTNACSTAFNRRTTTSIVLGEYRYGLNSSRLRVARESWLDELESTATVLTITSETSRVYADIRYELRLAGQPIPENDLWIAALARQHGLSVLSNDAHFDQVSGLGRIGW